MKKLIVITTLYNRTKLYVSEITRRPDKKIAIVTTKDPAEAHDFESRGIANELISRFINPYDRTYAVEQITVEKKKQIINDEKFN